LKIGKELKVGLIAVFAIVLLVVGINFLKGYSLFGGDDTYYAYFPNSASLMVSNDVTLNGVVIGKVLEIDNIPQNPINRRVRIKFSISDDNIKLPKGTLVELGNIDIIKKGLIINYPTKVGNNYYSSGQEIPGKMTGDMFSQVKQYADPISQKIQLLVLHIDSLVNSVSGVFNKDGTADIVSSIRELKLTVKSIGELAQEAKFFVVEEKIKFAKIMENVENITLNLKKSNDAITTVLGNAKKITDDLVSADFKGTILEAQTTLKKLNFALEDINQGKGTFGKLIKDEKLYTELIETNNELQELVDDLQANPQRYIHISAFGRKNKGVELTNKQELKLKRILDSIPD
jgi:phospholipid/cholesterol/gamma-HCH transport system substrate-binding protein